MPGLWSLRAEGLARGAWGEQDDKTEGDPVGRGHISHCFQKGGCTAFCGTGWSLSPVRSVSGSLPCGGSSQGERRKSGAGRWRRGFQEGQER